MGDMPTRDRRFVVVDLAGSVMGPGWLSVELEVEVDVGEWPDKRIRRGAADRYGVPIEQVGPVTERALRGDQDG